MKLREDPLTRSLICLDEFRYMTISLDVPTIGYKKNWSNQNRLKQKSQMDNFTKTISTKMNEIGIIFQSK